MTLTNIDLDGFAAQLADESYATSMAHSQGCSTIEEVEVAELVGALPAGTTEILAGSPSFPSKQEVDFFSALRDFLWVENEFITEQELADSYDNPKLLEYALTDQSPEDQKSFMNFWSNYDSYRADDD